MSESVCAGRELNPRPSPYKSAALTIRAPGAHSFQLEPAAGFEPALFLCRRQVLCPVELRGQGVKGVSPAGFEPAPIPGLSRRLFLVWATGTGAGAHGWSRTNNRRLS